MYVSITLCILSVSVQDRLPKLPRAQVINRFQPSDWEQSHSLQTANLASAKHSTAKCYFLLILSLLVNYHLSGRFLVSINV